MKKRIICNICIFQILIAYSLCHVNGQGPVALLETTPPDGMHFIDAENTKGYENKFSYVTQYGEDAKDFSVIKIDGKNMTPLSASSGWIDKEQVIKFWEYAGNIFPINDLFSVELTVYGTDEESMVKKNSNLDTFKLTLPILELECYDFENGKRILWPPDYEGKNGEVGEDYYTSSKSNNDFRPIDKVGIIDSGDYFRRHEWVAGDDGVVVFDKSLTSIREKDWFNYTSDLPQGHWQPHLRIKLNSQSDAKIGFGTVNSKKEYEEHGKFNVVETKGVYKTVSLSENGIPIYINGGRNIFRLRVEEFEGGSGDVFLNYLVFVPPSNEILLLVSDNITGPWREKKYNSSNAENNEISFKSDHESLFAILHSPSKGNINVNAVDYTDGVVKIKFD